MLSPRWLRGAVELAKVRLSCHNRPESGESGYAKAAGRGPDGVRAFRIFGVAARRQSGYPPRRMVPDARAVLRAITSFTLQTSWAGMDSHPYTANQVHRMLLECTETYFTDRNTGIERVVRNIANNCTEVGRQVGVDCRPIVRLGDTYAAVPWKPRLSRARRLPSRILRSLVGSERFWHRTAFGRTVTWSGTRLRKLLYPRSLVRNTAKLWSPARRAKVVPGHGDALVLLDAWWNPDAWPAVLEARRNGAKIGIVVYDLLPITNPEFFRPDVTASFTLCMERVLEQGDFFVAISATVRDTLREYAIQHGPPRLQAAAFTSFQLGSTLDMTGCRGKPRRSLMRVFETDAASPPYLAVGTVEPRKNQALLVDVFERVWQWNQDVRLVIVGRVGWLCESLITRITNHRQYEKSLFMFNDLSDSELEYCYRSAKALLFPSHAEGFGLPVVEAMRHELPVMASDIPIHREVGGDFCAYFDNRTPEHLCDLIRQFEQHGQLTSVRSSKEFETPDWNVSTDEFVRECLDACQQSDSAGRACRRSA